MVSTSTSSTAVCTVTYAVAGPAVSAVPKSSAVAVVENPWKWKRLTDPADRSWAWESFQDWWASRRSTPSTGTSSAPQPPLITPPIDPVPGPSLALALPAAAVLSSSSVASSGIVFIPLSRVASFPAVSQSRLHRLSRIHRLEVPGPIPGPVTRLQAVYRPGTHCPAIPRAVHRPGTRRLAVPGPVSRPFPVLFPDLSPVWRPSHRPGHVSRPFPDLLPV